MKKKLAEQLYLKLQGEMEKADQIELPLEKLKTGLASVQQILVALRVGTLETEFSTPEEEVRFFKYEKPPIYAWLIFITERYAIEINFPRGKKEEQITYLNHQILYINRFFRQNEFLYQYYRLDANELDGQYFIRGKNAVVLGFSEVPEIDREFGTPADYLFSKFIAYEKILDYLLREIEILNAAGGEQPFRNKIALKWTGDSVNLIELIYGIYETGQINSGEASLAELMNFFGQLFEINLTRYFKKFTDIKMRKSMSKTRFLDEMQKLVNKRIEDGDAFIPTDQKSRYGY
ncbi:hypothetical protein DHW03_15405 [Pedobacter yonginense]|uniref:Tetracycline regulation of excision, RteC n=1 Tax=Pedobacter yonginense TaxID=651869 RepID=A0A317EH90_9SPHI|nr:RteC domain-containing protein [Pedobacter yonginense]PWS26180.1 hypothetical protein DHW03_15405 [Pedobacter yonginense]